MYKRQPLELYQNTSVEVGGWLTITVSQPAPNVDAVGAFIEVQTSAGLQTREVTIGGGHVSGSLGAHHFGLGNATSVKVRVIWPDGDAGAWQKVEPNTALDLSRRRP